jgi:hypothetical protein
LLQAAQQHPSLKRRLRERLLGPLQQCAATGPAALAPRAAALAASLLVATSLAEEEPRGRTPPPLGLVEALRDTSETLPRLPQVA